MNEAWPQSFNASSASVFALMCIPAGLTNQRLGPLMYPGILSEIEDELLPFGHALEPTPVLDFGPP